MGERENEAAVRRLRELLEARKWDEAGALVASDVVVTWPHTRERFRGRRNFIEMNRAFPGQWRIRID